MYPHMTRNHYASCYARDRVRIHLRIRTKELQDEILKAELQGGEVRRRELAIELREVILAERELTATGAIAE